MNFKELMRYKGYTQSKLSKKLRTEYHHYKFQQQISDWINGVRLPDIETLYYISKILNISCDDLIPMFLNKYKENKIWEIC